MSRQAPGLLPGPMSYGIAAALEALSRHCHGESGMCRPGIGFRYRVKRALRKYSFRKAGRLLVVLTTGALLLQAAGCTIDVSALIADVADYAVGLLLTQLTI